MPTIVKQVTHTDDIEIKFHEEEIIRLADMCDNPLVKLSIFRKWVQSLDLIWWGCCLDGIPDLMGDTFYKHFEKFLIAVKEEEKKRQEKENAQTSTA
jgi:hypothetical protein